AFEQIARRHRTAVTQLVKRARVRARADVDALLAELHSTLQGIHLLRHCPVRALDMTASFGERLSALIMAAYLNQKYPALFVGAAVDASVIEIWTDVDGVLSADPRVVPSAFVLPQMTYEEAMELSYFGAKVLHSATIAPAVARRIPILIKNTFNPDAPGTLISTRAVDDGKLAKGITSVGDLALLTLRGPGMVGVPGVAGRVFG